MTAADGPVPGTTVRPAAVIFDLDDTLIVEESFAMASLCEALAILPGVDPEPSAPDALEAIRTVWRTGPVHARCVELGFASWEGLWSTFAGNHRALDGLEEWAPRYRAEAWEVVASTFGVDDPGAVRAAADRFDAAQRRGHPPIEGMREVLDRLTGRFPVGLLTNGPSDIQRLKLEQAGLSDTFDTVVVSGEVGVGKPTPAVFDLVLDRLGARAEHSVMVGDSWERDIVGALGAGLTAVWIADGRTPPAEDLRVTVVDSVRELDGLLV